MYAPQAAALRCTSRSFGSSIPGFFRGVNPADLAWSRTCEGERVRGKIFVHTHEGTTNTTITTTDTSQRSWKGTGPGRGGAPLVAPLMNEREGGVCVRERQTERVRDRKKERKKEREGCIASSSNAVVGVHPANLAWTRSVGRVLRCTTG